jgi:putative hydrolase of the HAD superfamily
MIEAVIWDMGGVVNRYFTQVMVDEGTRRGWPLDRIPLGPTGLIPDPSYQAMLEGEIDEPEYYRRLMTILAAEGISYDPRTEPDWGANQRAAAWALIDRLHRQGWRQAVLTNDATAWMGAGWWETWDPIRYFEVLIDVATLGVRKPHPDTYLAVASALALPPQACLFVDDMPVNLRGAEAVGMASHLIDITRADESLAALAARLEHP